MSSDWPIPRLARSSIQAGMPIRGSRRRPLGRVVACGSQCLLLRTPWSRRRYALPYRHIESLRGGIVHIPGGKALFLPPDAAQGPLESVHPLDPRAATVAEASGATPMKRMPTG